MAEQSQSAPGAGFGTAPGPLCRVVPVLDLGLGGGVAMYGAGRRIGRWVSPLVEAATPALRVALHPPLIPDRHTPGRILARLRGSGTARRLALTSAARRGADRALDVTVPWALSTVLSRADITSLINSYVDLDSLVAKVDVNAVAQTIDLDILGARLDVEAIVRRLDLTAIVAENVDLDSLVTLVDVNSVAGRVDIDAIIERIDLIGITEGVLDAINLPEIVRDATGSVASETVRGARMQGIAADQAVSRVVDRLLLRRGPQSRPDDGAPA